MRLVLWVSLAVIVYTYAGYPVAIAALAWMWPRPWRRAAWEAGGPPPISMVMPVHNGAGLLAGKLEHLLALDAALVGEIVVVSDGSTDATAEILRQTEAPRLRAVILEEQGGKAVALNHGIAAATGEILVFIDARARLRPGALAALLNNFADANVGCVAGELHLERNGDDLTVSAMGGLYWRYERWMRTCEAAFDSPVGVSGCFYAIRRSLATALAAGTLLDDMFQPLCVIRQGYRSVVERAAIVTDTLPSRASGEFQRKVRTLAGNFQLVAVAPWILTPKNRVLFQLISHKLLRLVVPYFLVALLLSSAWVGAESGWLLVFAIAQAAFWLMAAMALKWKMGALQKVAAPASALLVLNAAAVVGLWRFLFTKGPLWKIWSPTAAPAE